MPDPLESAFEKVRWANSHLVEFEAKKRAFVDSRAYRVKSEYANREEREWIDVPPEGFRDLRGIIKPEYRRNGPRGPQISILKTEYVRLSLDVIRPMPNIAWAVMIGNIVHNLRSALDILVWELSVKHQTALPAPLPVEPLALSSPWRQVQFPIITDDTKWNGESRKRLKLIDPALLTEFKELQPWYTGQNNGRPPEGEWLAILQELWNRDKHRGVSFIAANAVLRDLTLLNTRDMSPLTSFTAREIERVPFGPVEHDTPLGLWALDANTTVFGNVKVGVYSNIAFNVMLAKGSPAEGRSVSDAMEALIDTVTTILRQFSPQLI